MIRRRWWLICHYNYSILSGEKESAPAAGLAFFPVEQDIYLCLRHFIKHGLDTAQDIYLCLRHLQHFIQRHRHVKLRRVIVSTNLDMAVCVV